VVYGALPPESRSQQAKLFNDTQSIRRILIGTDAIGMGLNLNIGRIIFSSCEKFDGESKRTLLHSEIRQIAGRAGRYGSIFPNGKVTSLFPEDLKLIHEAISSSSIDNDDYKAVILPSNELLFQYYTSQKEKLFSVVLRKYFSSTRVDDTYELARYENLVRQAGIIDNLNLSLSERYIYCMAPVDLESNQIRDTFYNLAEQHANQTTVNFQEHTLSINLLYLEQDYRRTELYIWLANRFPLLYVDREIATTQLTIIMQSIHLHLTTDQRNSRLQKKLKNMMRESAKEASQQKKY